jgi:glycosyltransferase involved in cell wall biosynthesis
MRAQFVRSYFAAIRPAQPAARPFRVTFVGRLQAEKGALDIVAMARHAEARAPGLIRWTICGGGSDLDVLRADVAVSKLDDVVIIRGWTTPAELQHVYGESHASIVPTRSSFAEGLAMTAVEAILSGRALITNPVVPALELLQDAAVAAVTDDPTSHADAVLALATDSALYGRLAAACATLGEPFLDRKLGLTAVLHAIFAKKGP